MISKGRDAGEDGGLELAVLAQIALRAEHLPAAGTERQHAARGSGIMRQPETQVRRERQGVQQPLFGTSGADLDEPFARLGQVRQIAPGKEKGRRLGTAPGGEGHEYRAKVEFQFARQTRPATRKHAKDIARTPRQRFLVGRKNEFAKMLRLVRRIEQIGFRGERDFAQVLERAERDWLQTVLLEER